MNRTNCLEMIKYDNKTQIHLHDKLPDNSRNKHKLNMFLNQ